MATIKPANYAYTHSPAEEHILKEIEKLDKDKTKDWVIFYSYCFKGKEKYNTIGDYMYDDNEIDFLILAPNYGFFVFEIKGGRIKYENERLYSIDRNNKKNEIDPFAQAKRNYYSLDKIVGDFSTRITNDGKLKNLSFADFVGGYLVGFPSISSTPDVGPISNGKDVYVAGDNLFKFIESNANFSKDRNSYKAIPTKEDVDNLIKKLEGSDFEYSLSKKDYINSVNLSINELTEEQKGVFNGLLLNKRCLIKGKAGTGKTILCEFLYKKLSLEKKYSVIYFSFNKLIAKRVNKDVEDNGESNCYPIYEYLEKEYNRVTNEALPEELSSNFEKKKSFLFSNVSKLIQEDIHAKKYDCVIIDEAQDIEVTDDVILFFDSLLNDGLKDGMCYLFYDDKQDIFNNGKTKIYEDEIFGDTGNNARYAKFELNTNCRNGELIAKTLNTIVSKKDKANNLQKINDSLANEDFTLYVAKDNENIVSKIKEIINNLKVEGIENKQITLLFNRTIDDNKILNILKENSNDFVEYGTTDKNKITYSNIHRFKGLENDVIIYINDYKYAKASNHYVAISRARALAYVIVLND